MKSWQHLLLTLTLLCGLPYAACRYTEPVTPQPVATGGTVSTGGTTAAGGASATGGQSATGGTTATTIAEIRFPACNPASHSAKPIDHSKVKLGRRHVPISKARKASYEIDLTAKSVFWPPTVPWALNQGDLGACTGFAVVQARLTQPFTLQTIPGTPTTKGALEQLGRDVYSGATRRDVWKGAWPPDDTGSSGSAALDEAVARRIFNSYSTVSSLAEMQRALQSGPLIFGVDWYDGMFKPARCGEIKATGQIRGGHEIAIVGLDVDAKTVWGETSWDNDFGVCLDSHCGYFYMTYGLVSQLFAQGGEAEQPANDNADRYAVGF